MGKVDLRQFDGTSDPGLWITHMQWVTAANQWSDDVKMTQALATLSRTTVVWLESKHCNGFGDWGWS